MTGDIFLVCVGVGCFLMGWGFCKLFGCSKKKVEQCETAEDILKREG